MKPPTRIIDGIILVNKPQGLTSNGVLQRVKHLFRAKKAGHTGSLDPLATGMLPLCFGEATKFCQYLLDADKCYETTGLLGVTTDTGDSMGEVIARAELINCSTEALHTALSQYRGPIQQIPPMYSALKHQGKPLYKYARAGVTLERPPRDITIHTLELQAFDGQRMDLTVKCSKGTYIRSLVESIGNALGVGAHVTRLHRSYTAGFEHEPMYTLDALAEMTEDQLLACLLPMERAVHHLPIIIINQTGVQKLRDGKSLEQEDLLDNIGCVRLYDENGAFIGLGESLPGGVLMTKRLLAFNSRSSLAGSSPD